MNILKKELKDFSDKELFELYDFVHNEEFNKLYYDALNRIPTAYDRRILKEKEEQIIALNKI